MACKLPCVSDLKRRVEIQKPNCTQDEGGGQIVSWEQIAKPYAKIVPVSASQKLWAKSLDHHVSHKVTIRYSKSLDLSIAERILYDGRIFQIHGFRNLNEENRYYEIDCMEGVES